MDGIENQLINIDSRFRDRVAHPNAGKFTWMLDQPLRNVEYVRLSSIEMPNAHYTFTAERNNVSFTVTVNGSPHVVTIPEGNYTYALLLDTLHTRFEQLNDDYGYDLKITVSEITAKVTMKVLTGTLSLNFTGGAGGHRSLGYQLGFRNNTYSGAIAYTGEATVDTLGDQYVFLRVNDYGVMYNQTGRRDVLGKIILTNAKYSVVYDNESSLLTKTYQFRQPANIQRLDFEVLDPFGNVVDMQGQELSLTLEVGYIRHSAIKRERESRFNL